MVSVSPSTALVAFEDAARSGARCKAGDFKGV